MSHTYKFKTVYEALAVVGNGNALVDSLNAGEVEDHGNADGRVLALHRIGRALERLADLTQTPEATALLKAITNPVIVMSPPKLEDL